MRNLLLATSALVVAGSMFASPAMAQNKPITMSIGGYFNYVFGIVSQDDGTGQAAEGFQDNGFLSDGELHFNGVTTLDNGLTVGLRVELETTTSADQIDETYVYFRSQYGEIRVGQDDSPANAVTLSAPGAIARLGLADPANVFTTAPTGHRGNGNAVDPEGGNFTSDSEKITYWTPTIAGFQVGISYTADGTETGTPRAATSALGNTGATGAAGTVGAQENVWEVGGTYKQTIQGIGISLNAAYSRGTNERPGVYAGGTAFAGATSDDRTEWAVGGQLSYMGFTVGGGYRNDNNAAAGRNETNAWVAGLMYTMGPWSVSAGYGVSQTETGNGFTGEDETKHWEVAVNYVLGPGIEIYAAVIGTEYDNVADQALAGAANILDNDATTFAVGTRLVF
jgi:outer membrane protein OmpU